MEFNSKEIEGKGTKNEKNKDGKGEYAKRLSERYDEKYGLPMSISSLQISLCIGFPYASKIMQRLEDAGLIVQDEKGQKYLNVIK